MLTTPVHPHHSHTLALRSEEHNKRVFHQQMVETGSSLLFDGEYGGGAPAQTNFYPSPGAGGGGGGYGGGYGGASAPYMPQQQYVPQGYSQQRYG